MARIITTAVAMIARNTPIEIPMASPVCVYMHNAVVNA